MRLGVEPGEEPRRLHQQILARDPFLAAPAQRDAAAGRPDAVGVVPRQLPASVACFAGRSGELEVLAGLAEQAACGTGGMVVISAIGGRRGATRIPGANTSISYQNVTFRLQDPGTR